jgi:hypothetical protein
MNQSGESNEPAPRTPPKSNWKVDLLGTVLALAVLSPCFYLLAIPVCNIRDAARHVRSANNLRQIGVAIYRFEEANGELPTNTYALDGTPLLSWRVHILPFIEQEDLYRQFKLDEPWNSPHNIQLLNQMPAVYANPKDKNIPANTSVYRGFSSPGAVFEKRPSRNPAAHVGGGMVELRTRFRLADFKDPLTDTILVIEAADSVEWTKPDGLEASRGKPLPPLLEKKPGWPQALLADGSVRGIDPQNVETRLPAMVTHSGGEKLPP